MNNAEKEIIWFDDSGSNNIATVGGKNASLGELVQNLASKGISIPIGFSTHTDMFKLFVESNNLHDLIKSSLDGLDNNEISLSQAGLAIRSGFLKGEWPKTTSDKIISAYETLCTRTKKPSLAVAVRSSATAEDLPEASFAGQQESFLNVSGAESVLSACKSCYASLFTDRAISYRNAHNFDHFSIALSVGVQQMVKADNGSSGVMFTLDSDTGFDKVVLVSSVWGLGENIVQGFVDPDEFCVYKPFLNNTDYTPIIKKILGSKKQKMIYNGDLKQPTRNIPCSLLEQKAYSISDSDVLELARQGCLIEEHYQCPMDMEWARDGESGKLYIVQARPETVQSQQRGNTLTTYHLNAKTKALISGLAIGKKVVSAPVCLIKDIKDIDQFIDGSILVTVNTDPDWVPLMKRAVAIVTDHGGRTSHAAIVSREMGLPAILGSGNATTELNDEQLITVSCAEGDIGFVYDGNNEFTVEEIDLDAIGDTQTKVMLNLANPAAAFQWWRLPADGIGLVRMEFVISNHVKVHPLALIHFDKIEDKVTQQAINKLSQSYSSKSDYFVDTLALGLAPLAALFYPHPAIIRMSDFKTNEYSHLLGGEYFELEEENPMLGFRGASRYYSPLYKQAFALECKAIKKIREKIGFNNVIVMIPFCRTINEAKRVNEVLVQNGLVRGEAGLQVYMMCEIPSNVILAQKFAQYFDGFSIGSNDLTQLTLGVDRDSSELAELFNEQDEAVKWSIKYAINEAHAAKVKIGLCGQAPSDHPEFSEFLVKNNIDSLSVSPDSFLSVKQQVVAAEKL